MSKLTPKKRALLALVILCLVWGYSWIVMKQALQFSGPFFFAALRTALAALCLFALMIALKRPLGLRHARAVLLIAFFQTTLFVSFTMWALVGGAVGKTAVLNFTMPFWVVLFAWPILGERVRGIQWLPIVVAFVGLILVVQPWRLGSALAASALAIFAGLSWAFATIIVKRLKHELPRDPLALTAWQMLFGTLPLIAVAWLLPERPTTWNAEFVATVIYLSLVGTAAGWWLWLYALSKLPAGVASLNTLAIPALAVIFAWVLLGETPNGYEALGMLFIAAALVLLSAHQLRGAGILKPNR